MHKFSITLSSCIIFHNIDIDECNVELHMCDVNAYCNNTDGSYDCTCKSNFFGNGTICEGTNFAKTTSVIVIKCN